jgi:phosphonatase-like hydrolase
MNKIITPKTRMMVFDMAGTVINEGGLVYKMLYQTLDQFNVFVCEKEIKEWHGKNKYEALDYFLQRSLVKNGANFQDKKYKLSELEMGEFQFLRPTLHHIFDKNLKDVYFSKNTIKFIDDKLPSLFCKIRENNIKIALNSGYSKDIQERIIHNLHFKELIDDYISSDVVQKGRPEPYMINALIRRNDILSPEHVIKFGDTQNDILEGHNARCQESIGVLSGAGNKEDFESVGATRIIDSVMKID